MFNADPKRPLVWIVAFLEGCAVLSGGFGAILWRGDLHYTNWFGQLVFAPFAILLGSAMILAALFKPEVLGRPPTRSKR